MALFTFAFVVLLSALGHLQATKFVVKTYFNTDVVHKNHNPAANVEVHCMELDDSNNPIYIRGNYGQRGYFEGPMSNTGEAMVNFYEVGYVGREDLFTDTGAGVLHYDPQLYTFQRGKFWSSGSSSDVRSGGDWGITQECPHSARECLNLEKGTPLVDIIFQYCFWDVTGNMNIKSSDDVPEFNTRIYGSNPNTFFVTNFGYSNGSMVGAYQYTYSKEDCKELDCKSNGAIERGVYGNDGLLVTLKTAKLIVARWDANSGPFKGQSGSTLYAAISGKNEKNAQIIGFYCNSMKAKMGKEFTSCAYDNNLLMKKTKQNFDEAKRLLSFYPKGFQRFFQGIRQFLSLVNWKLY